MNFVIATQISNCSRTVSQVVDVLVVPRPADDVIPAALAINQIRVVRSIQRKILPRGAINFKTPLSRQQLGIAVTLSIRKLVALDPAVATADDSETVRPNADDKIVVLRQKLNVSNCNSVTKLNRVRARGIADRIVAIASVEDIDVIAGPAIHLIVACTAG